MQMHRGIHRKKRTSLTKFLQTEKISETRRLESGKEDNVEIFIGIINVLSIVFCLAGFFVSFVVASQEIKEMSFVNIQNGERK
jgi:hypothetical protein